MRRFELGQALDRHVQKFYWANPHAFTYLLALDDNNGSAERVIEVGTPTVNLRNGRRLKRGSP